MKKIISILFLAIMALGCSKEEQTPNTALQNADSFNVSVEQTGTKTTVNENYQIIWSEGDKISVFPTTESNHEYSYGGFEESTSAKFYKTSEDQETGTPLNAFYGIYPYNASTTVSPDGEITLSLPAEQQYASNSFAPGTNTMVAVSSGTNDKNLAFKSVCGFIRIRLYGNAVISCIELKGNRNETISGTTTVTASSSTDPEVQIAGGNNASTAITLKCPDEGIAIGATKDKATSFWFTVPPVTFEEGFTITVETTEGTIRTKTTDKQYTVNRNELKTMEAVLISEEQPNNEIWYTTTDGNPIQLRSTDGFGSTFVEHTYANGKGKIKFAGEVTRTNVFSNNINLKTISLPEKVYAIDQRTFYNCINLEEITLPDGIEVIGDYAFVSCAKLTSITIPTATTVIGTCAFEDCHGLTSITCNENLKTIDRAAFEGCYGLTSIILNDNLKSIGKEAFEGCYSLSTISIPNLITKIDAKTFAGCSSLTSVSLPQNLETIGDDAFSGCEKLDNIIIPNSVTSIGSSAFSSCQKLTNITLSNNNNFTTIQSSLFFRCYSLASITIPANIKSIQNNAFNSCNGLKTIFCHAITPPQIGEFYVFPDVDFEKIYVPTASINKYKAADGWKEYASLIEALPTNP